MVPGLLVGDFLFVSKYSYGYSSLSTLFGLLPVKGRLFGEAPKRGDVVVFKLPRDTSVDYIKRLVGLPGDTIEMRNGLLYINGVAVDRQRLAAPVAEDYLKTAPNVTDYVETFPGGAKHVIREEGDDYTYDNTPVYHVPPGHYFMMGDNRDNSLDSRTSNVGFVPADNIVGKAQVIFFSLDEQARFWQFWKWPFAVRWGRLLMKIS
jgi:signal peptidase I